MMTSLNFDAWFEWLNKLPPVSLLCVFVLAFGYLLKRAEWVENKRIPLIVSCVGAFLYLGLRYGFAIFIAQGFVMSGLVTIGHRYFIRPFEDKYPWLKKFLCGTHGGFDSNPRAFVRETPHMNAPAPKARVEDTPSGPWRGGGVQPEESL